MGLFSGSIPPSFVLSNNLSTTNTQAIWLCSGAFLSAPVPSHRIHWPLTTDYCSRATVLPPLAPRSTPHAPRSTPHQRVQAGHRPFPAGYCHHRPPNCQRLNGTRSRRAAGPYSVCHRNSVCYQTRQFLRTNPSVSPRSPPPDRRPFARGRRRSTPGAPDVPVGWPSAGVPVLSPSPARLRQVLGRTGDQVIDSGWLVWDDERLSRKWRRRPCLIRSSKTRSSTRPFANPTGIGGGGKRGSPTRSSR